MWVSVLVASFLGINWLVLLPEYRKWASRRKIPSISLPFVNAMLLMMSVVLVLMLLGMWFGFATRVR
jgi:hypothetical protein